MASRETHGRQTPGADSAAASSGEATEQRGDRVLSKSTSRMRRELAARESLDSTDALVTAYNESSDGDEHIALQEWLYMYGDWLHMPSAKSWRVDVLNEIASLARIEPRCRADAKLVRKTIFYLGNQVKNSSLEQKKTVSALSKALEAVDESVFEGDVSELLGIAETLLCRLDPAKVTFTEGTFPTNKTTLFALHQVFLVVQRVSPRSFNAQHQSGIFQNYKKLVTQILDCQDYFPSFFAAKLVEQCFLRLSRGSTFTMHDMPRKTVSLLLGCAYLYSGVRNAVVAAIDVDSLRKAYEQFREVLFNHSGEDMWYDEYVALTMAAVLSCEVPDREIDLANCLQRARDAVPGINKREDRNLLRFGVVNVLHSLALNGSTFETRRWAVDELMYIGTQCMRYEGWANEPTIVEGLLDALWSVITQKEHTDLALVTLEVMSFCEDSTIQVRRSISL